MTPPHSVLSRSRIRHFAERPCLAARIRPTRSPYRGEASGVISCFARCQRTGSCQAPMPSVETRSSSERKSTHPSAFARRRSLRARTRRSGEPGRRCSLFPMSGRGTGNTVCCSTVDPNNSRTLFQRPRNRETDVSNAASAAAGSATGTSASNRWKASNANRTTSGLKRLSAEAGSRIS